MKKMIAFLILLLICFPVLGQELPLAEWYWNYYVLPNDEYAISIIHEDDLQFPTGSAPLNPGMDYENFNGTQMTFKIDVEALYFVPGDGVAHKFFDNLGTSNTQNRLRMWINKVGILQFDVDDKDITCHCVDHDISDWVIGSTHQIIGILDFNNDDVGLYIDGILVDDIPDNPFSSDSIDVIGTHTHVGSNTNFDFHLNGSMTFQIWDIPQDSIWVADQWNSGDLLPSVVDFNTILLLRTSEKKTGIVYWHKGKKTSNIIDNANDSELTTAAGADESFSDGDAVSIQGATGIVKYGFVDGSPSDTSVLVDDGAGALVSGGLSSIGVSMFCDGNYEANGGDILDVTTDFWEADFWFKIDGIPVELKGLFGKKTNYLGSGIGYLVWLQTNGRIYIDSYDGTNAGSGYADITNLLDNRWHHFHGYYDRAALGNLTIYLDGVAQGVNTSGTIPVNILTNARDFIIGGRDGGDGDVIVGSIRDVLFKTTGTAASAAQILYRAAHPGDLTANSWTLDGTREAWAFTANTGTNVPALVDSPANDLTMSSALGWNQQAYVSKDLLLTDENGGIGGVSNIDSTWTVTKDTTTKFQDSRSLRGVCAAGDDGDEFTLASPQLVNGQDYWQTIRAKVADIDPASELYLDVDGASTPITSIGLIGPDDAGGFIGTHAVLNGSTEYFSRSDADFPESGILGDFTIQFWLNPTDVALGNRYIVSKFDFGTDKRMYAIFRPNSSDEISITVSDNGLGAAPRTTTNCNLVSGIWAHLAIVYDSVAGSAIFYKNGVLLTDDGTVLEQGAFDTDATFRIGALDGDNYVSGSIFNLALFNDKRTAGEILVSYQNPNIDLSGEGNLVGQWKFGDLAAATQIYNLQGDAGGDLDLVGGDSTNYGTHTRENEWGIKEFCWKADQTAIEVNLRATGAGGASNAVTVNVDAGQLRVTVAGDSLSANMLYTLVYNVDTGETGAEWSGLGLDAIEVAAGDLYIKNDIAPASVDDKGPGFWSLFNPLGIPR